MRAFDAKLLGREVPSWIEVEVQGPAFSKFALGCGKCGLQVTEIPANDAEFVWQFLQEHAHGFEYDPSIKGLYDV